VKLLLFDLDGTLVLAGGAGRKALNRAIYNLYGVKQDVASYNLAGKTDLRNFAEAARGALGKWPRRREIDRVHDEYLQLLPKYVRAAVRSKKYKKVPGVERLLKRLAKADHLLLALGTGNMEQGARIKLEPSGFNKYFSFGGYGSDGFRRPTLLRRAFKLAQKQMPGIKLKRSEVYVIGDTPLDVKAGKEAGFKTIAVGTGWSPWPELVAAKPTHIAKNFSDLKRWCKWFGVRA
jgi:phosphoglycolate phosphatase